ncbi:hypothetical protein [uncultured Thiodictyon sp.]|uniref:hypothetical protein n=1 Tax=uncultured Thiodictyon sp. TaxID=1846217 RepID=UPI0025E7ECBE|nr:hypothetical protein [uncultured Thiodictyon sp.]
MQSLTLKLIGESSLLLHSDRGANPIAPATVAHKVLTSKRKKTEEDHVAIARSEFLLGFYNGDGVVMPSTNVKSAIVEGAKLNKLGSAFNRCLLILADAVPITHSGPATPAAMWEVPSCVDCRSVKVGTARLMRYRPRLNDWQLSVDIFFDETVVERNQILAAAQNAGKYIGLGDYRPARGGSFGRFAVQEA